MNSDSVPVPPRGLNLTIKRIEEVKKFVEDNDGKILRMEDFDRALNTTTAAKYIKNLVNHGLLLRIAVTTHKPGHFYTYKWNYNQQARFIDTQTIELIAELAREWQENQTGDDESVAMKNLGVTQFVKYIKETYQPKAK